MKTLDGINLIKNIVANYPEGSLSPRQIILTIPMDFDEDRIQKINFMITKTIFDQSSEYLKTLKPKKNLFSDNSKECEEYKKGLTQAIVDTVYQTTIRKK